MNALDRTLTTIDRWSNNNRLIAIITKLGLLGLDHPTEFSSLLDRIEKRIEFYERSI